MWTTFWLDMLVGIIGAVLAALIAVGLARMTYHQEKKKQEVAALRRLIGELARRRALIRPASLARSEAAGPGHPDFEAVSTSVFNVRQAIDEARRAVREDEGFGVHPVLDQMSIHCNEYLHGSRHHRQNYLALINELRNALIEEIHQLRQIHPELPVDEPGSKAYANRDARD